MGSIYNIILNNLNGLNQQLLSFNKIEKQNIFIYKYLLDIITKDGRNIKLLFANIKQNNLNKFINELKQNAFTNDIQQSFAFHATKHSVEIDGWNVYDFFEEFTRQKVPLLTTLYVLQIFILCIYLLLQCKLLFKHLYLECLGIEFRPFNVITTANDNQCKLITTFMIIILMTITTPSVNITECIDQNSRSYTINCKFELINETSNNHCKFMTTENDNHCKLIATFKNIKLMIITTPSVNLFKCVDQNNRSHTNMNQINYDYSFCLIIDYFAPNKHSETSVSVNISELNQEKINPKNQKANLICTTAMNHNINCLVTYITYNHYISLYNHLKYNSPSHDAT